MKEKKEENKEKADETETLPEWTEDETVPFPDDENSEVIKLQVDEYIEGKLVDIVPSTTWKGRNIYKVKEKDRDTIKVLLGTTILDRQMSTKSVGDYVKIERLMDKPTDKGNPLQQYRTYSRAVKSDGR
jgi:hypothetical protein